MLFFHLMLSLTSIISENEFKSGWYITTKGTQVLLLFLLSFYLMLNLTFLTSEFISFSGYSLFTNHDLIFYLFCTKLLSLEYNLLMHKVWLKITKHLAWFGWPNEKCKYWWRSVGFSCKSVVIFPLFSPTLGSRNWIFSTLYSYVIFMNWLKSLSFSENFLRSSLRWIQMKKYHQHTVTIPKFVSTDPLWI